MASSFERSGPRWVSVQWLTKQEATIRRKRYKAPDTFEQFAQFCRIKTKREGILRFRPEVWHEEQRRFQAERTGRDIVLKSRQIGFTTLELLRGLYASSSRESFNTVIVGHDGALVMELFEHVRFAADGLARIGRLPPMSRDTMRQMRFENLGSSITCTEAGATERSASKKGHSGTIHRLHATEVARWSEPDTTMTGLLGAVPSDGEIVIESVAAGAFGWFYDKVQEARRGEGRYKLHFYPWFLHARYREPVRPDFDPAPLDEVEQELRRLGCDDEQVQFWRDRVKDHGPDTALEQYPPTIDLAFRATGRTWFEQKALDRLARGVCEPIRVAPVTYKGRRLGDLLVWHEPLRGGAYVVFGDVAEGIAGDGHSATVMDRDGVVQATFWSDSIEPGEFGIATAVIGWLYGTALVGIERNNHGHAALLALREIAAYSNVYIGSDGRYGWDTNPATRPILWEDLAYAIRDGVASSPDAAAVEECKNIVRDKDGKPRARGKRDKRKDSARDDRYVSWAGAWQIRTEAGTRQISGYFPGL